MGSGSNLLLFLSMRFCIEHTSMTSRQEIGAQAKFATKSCLYREMKNTYRWRRIYTQRDTQRQRKRLSHLSVSFKNFSSVPDHLSSLCFSVSLLIWWLTDCTFQPHLSKFLPPNTSFTITFSWYRLFLCLSDTLSVIHIVVFLRAIWSQLAWRWWDAMKWVLPIAFE